jgi:hypothetical protein
MRLVATKLTTEKNLKLKFFLLIADMKKKSFFLQDRKHLTFLKVLCIELHERRQLKKICIRGDTHERDGGVERKVQSVFWIKLISL